MERKVEGRHDVSILEICRGGMEWRREVQALWEHLIHHSLFSLSEEGCSVTPHFWQLEPHASPVDDETSCRRSCFSRQPAVEDHRVRRHEDDVHVIYQRAQARHPILVLHG